MKPRPKCKRPAAHIDMDELKENKFIKEFINFYKIELKTDEELKELPIKRQKQYECRYKRWSGLIDSHIECEIHKSRTMFNALDEAILDIDRKIREATNDPEYDNKDADFKRTIERDEMKMNEVVKQLKFDRKKFEEYLEEFKKMQEEDRIREAEDRAREEEEERFRRDEEREVIGKLRKKFGIKEEVVSDSDNDMDYANGSNSGSDDDIKEEIEVKEEYESDEFSSEGDNKQRVRRQIKREVKKEPKKEVKTETDVKPKIEKEVKSEVKNETEQKEVKIKREYVSSDDEQ